MFREKLKSDLNAASSLDGTRVARFVQQVGFKCFRCSWCCRHDPDYDIIIKDVRRPSNAFQVFPSDIRNITIHTGLELLDIVEPDIFSCFYDKLITGWIMKRGTNGSCFFLDEDRNRCSIYESRPLVCRCYPFFCSSRGMVDIRHCCGTYQTIQLDEAEALGKALIEYLIKKTGTYISIIEAAENIIGPLELDGFNEAKLTDGYEFVVIDGESCYIVKYDGDGFGIINE